MGGLSLMVDHMMYGVFLGCTRYSFEFESQDKMIAKEEKFFTSSPFNFLQFAQKIF